MTGWKKLLLALVLTFVAVWPVVHYALFRSLGLGAGTLFGLSEYAAPPADEWVLLYDETGGAEKIVHRGNLPIPVQLLYEDYKRRREALGELLPPHRLARAILDQMPEIADLKIVVAREMLVTSTARIRPTWEFAYIYKRRDGQGR